MFRALISRRALLSAVPAASMLGAPDWRQALSARVAALGGPGLLRSYDLAGTGDFDRTQANCAYVYDNAVVGLALLAAGDAAGARRIGDALVQAQQTDRFWNDGRLRNAYRAGPAEPGPYKLPGWWDAAAGRWMEDAYQAGTATGVLAWAMLLWIGLADRGHGEVFRAAAQRAADWIQTQRAPRGYAGGVIGFEPAPQRLTWVSTEQNIDVAAAFAAIGRAEAAAHARDFVAGMWQVGQGRFAIGLRPDGGLNDASAVDANLWPLLTSFARPAWRPALAWVLARHGLPVDAVDGVDFNMDRDGIWLEGTAITALACRVLGVDASRLMATLRAQTSPGGLIYAATTPTLTTGLSTGLDNAAPDFLYFRRPHIAPTAWAVLAQLSATPFPRAND
jgi:hypothetical protein